ncbi:hypothetical protein M3654_23285, partial [Bacillus licheniformis]|nr:hypothetical protein [Bacillus licheniformis]
MSDVNQATKRRQRILTVACFAVLAGLFTVGMFFTQSGPANRQFTTKVPFTSLGDQNDRNAWRAHSEAQLAELTRRMSSIDSRADDAVSQMKALSKAQDELSKRIDAMKSTPASAPAAAS